MRPTLPIYKDVVLLGGGHSHVEVVRRFGMRPVPGVRLTLVTPDVLTPYSGMLPGYVSGFYTLEACHIDLARLTQFAGARLILAPATGVDPSSQRVLFSDRPPLPYDILSINIGITPAVESVPGAAEFATPVKPISTFAAKLDAMLAAVRASSEPFKVVLVGGGPGGVELACALNYRLTREREKAGIDAPVPVTIVSRGPILAELASYARRAMLPLLEERGIAVREVEGGATSVSSGCVNLADGSELAFDSCLWCTEAAAAPWLAETWLPTDDRGFLQVNEFLQSDGGPENVFASGDIASSTATPRPKAGVYAVRAGPPLADNIARLAQGMPLRPWIPQSTNLNLISAGDKYAIGVKGWFGWQGAFLWTWKDWIDRKFMAKYGDDLDFNMDMNAPPTAGGEMGAVASPEAVALAAAAKMRCGGCGSKVGATTLERVLQQLRSDAAAHTAPPLTPAPPENVLVGIDIADDAAVLAAPPQGHVTVHTVDFFRAPAALNDPYTFGQVAANHALSDCYAMGAAPAAALAIVVLPFAAESKVESDLYQLMAGAVEVLARAGCSLVGGHTCEGAELALGFSIYGTAMPEQLMQRGGMAPGQALVLTKALGTGVLMAAAMRGQPVGRHLQAAIDGMILSNKGAAEVLKAYGATACADVTGFGLLGHLAEMARASKVAAVVSAGTVPLLPGASTCARSGVLSSMHVENAKVAAVLDEAGQWVGHEVWPLLVDPQTSGGLLASVPAGTAEECVRALQEAGYADAAVIGEVVEADSGSLIKLK